MRLAAPWLVGGLTAVVTALTASLEVFDLSVEVGAIVVAMVAALAGLVAWGMQRAAGAPAVEEPATPVKRRVPAQLPPGLAHFTGRADVLGELGKAAEEWRRGSRDRQAAAAPLVLSIHGPAGVGKSALLTRFGHQVASRYPDGQLYFNLRGTSGTRTRPEDVLTGFLLALGVRLTTDPGGLEELKALWRTWVSGSRLLIFLDNADDADQVQSLLPADAGCAVLVTSRQPLYLPTAYDTRLSEFTESQGVELLARLAGGERVESDLDSAVRIVRLCGYLPLAIGICGGRLAAREHWTLRELADRLADERRPRLDELQLGDQIERSVRASLRLSYNDCTAMQRKLLRSFGLLTAPDVPGWTAGELLGVPELEGVDHLEALVDAQLVEYSSTDRTGSRRYRLHDLVLHFARECAEREDDEEQRHAALARVIDGYRERAEPIAAERWPQDWHRTDRGSRESGPPALDWLTSERLAVLACIEQAQGLSMWNVGFRLGRAFCSLCHSLRVFWADWHRAAERTVQCASESGDLRSLGIALLERAAVVGFQGQLEKARTDGERALEIFTELREPWWAARARRMVGVNLRNAGNLDTGQEFLLEAIEGFKAEGDRWWQSRTQRNLADLRVGQRRYADARVLLDQALAVFQANGNRYSEAQTLRALGEVITHEARQADRAGHHEEAARKYSMASFTLERAAEMFRTAHEEWEEARCLRTAGSVGAPGNGLRELRWIRQAKSTLEALGDSWGVARSLVAEGHALNRLNRPKEAIAAMRAAVAAFRELDDRWWHARSLRALAELLLEHSRPGDAQEPAREALEIYQSLGNRSGVDRAQDVLGQTLS